MSKISWVLVIALLFAAFALAIAENPNGYAYCSFHQMLWHTPKYCSRYTRNGR